jgi:hypothetical protein
MNNPRPFQMITPQGFIKLFYQTVKEKQCKHAEAFELLNAEYEEFTGKKRYASYECFKVVKSKINKF